ncbi:hypothetical protein [Fodinibius halophilus]|uniref:Uncharacterized protein n=1 Tax=Fodinibius halophilus TaxID=1736908 RepID=A0A6M1T4G4_9BACT|nr:hypothetical protein [Fodinibius halophilus]NGP87553.1 hypothetical protein [Fodinibius halophilus]
MDHYYVHIYTDDDGDHEIHTDECDFLPKPTHRDYLGYYNNCENAVEEAGNNGYSPVNGCYFCSRDCHTS